MQGVDSDSDRIVRAGPFRCHIWPSLPHLRPNCLLRDRNILLNRSYARNEKVSHELPFCGVVAGPIGDWLRV